MMVSGQCRYKLLACSIISLNRPQSIKTRKGLVGKDSDYGGRCAKVGITAS